MCLGSHQGWSDKILPFQIEGRGPVPEPPPILSTHVISPAEIQDDLAIASIENVLYILIVMVILI